MSDKDVCEAKHRRWTDEVLTPKVKLIVGAMLGGCLSIALAAMAYVSANNVTAHELRDRDTYVTAYQHRQDMSDLSERIEKMDRSVAVGLQKLSDKLDRIQETRR